MPQDLRIGFVSIHDATDVNQWSGIPFHVLDGLRKLGCPVEVYSPLGQRMKYLLAPIKVLSRIRKTNLSLDHYPLMLRSYAGQIARAMRQRPVDVIVATSSIPIALLKGPEPILFWTDAVFHEMHTYYTGAFANLPPPAVERAKRQEEAALDNCTFAIYSSEWAAASARKLTDPAKICVLPFGASYSIENTRADVADWARQRRQQRPGSCELLFLGVDWKRKGGVIAVEAAKLLNESGIPTRLTVVGCQPPEPLPDFVRRLGFISKATPAGREQLQSLLRESDFLILPTIAEAAGIVFSEASAFGLPSLSYATGGVPDYVRTGVNGVCLPVGTPAGGFADTIRELLGDRDRYQALCLSSFEEYSGRLNWESSLRALLELCHRAADQRRNPSPPRKPVA